MQQVVGNFFSKFRRITIVLYVFLGSDTWERYGLTELFRAIADVRAQNCRNLMPSHRLILKRVGMSINKEMSVFHNPLIFDILPGTGLPKQPGT